MVLSGSNLTTLGRLYMYGRLSAETEAHLEAARDTLLQGVARGLFVLRRRVRQRTDPASRLC